MNLRKFARTLAATILFFVAISITSPGVSGGASAAVPVVANSQATSLSVGDFFLTEAELPAAWIPDPTPYTPGAHMRVKEKLMGGQWASVRIRNENIVIHITIGYFPSEAEAIKFSSPDTFIYRTDAYMETGKTFQELLQIENSQYSLTGTTRYGDGGFSGGYQHQEFQPFNVFRVGQVLFVTESTNASGEGVVEQLLVNKARQLLNLAALPESASPTPAIDTPQPPSLTPTLPSSPIVLKASLDGKGETTNTLANSSNFALITIHGIVTDQEGKGLGGATVTVVSGAETASSITQPDGSYVLTLSIPSGQGSNEVQDVNFTLQVGDLSIARVVLLQAIEGGQLVAARDVGVRVFLNWGLAEPVDVEVTLTVDNLELAPVRGIAKNSYTQTDRNRGADAINLVIPKDRFPSWGNSTHTLTAVVKLVSANRVDADTSNNSSPAQTFSLTNTRALNILYVSLDPSIGKSALVSFAAQAHSFLNKVYPISYSWGFVGTQHTSYYLVSPYVNYMKSLDADDLPFNMGDVGIVAGGLEVGKSFSYKSAIIAIEKARRLYNSQRCKDAQGKVILPCPDEVALQAVGVYPDGAFGSSKDGFAYVDQRNEWRAAANSQSKPNNVAHELGHLFGFGEEYDSNTPGTPVLGSTWDGVRFQSADGSCVNLMGNLAMACTWINAPTWNNLVIDSLKLSAPGNRSVASLANIAPRFEPLYTEVQSPALLIEGVVTSAGQGFLKQVSTLERYLQAENPTGQYILEAWDFSGNLLATLPFDGLFFDLDVNPVSVSPFLIVLPVADSNQVERVILRPLDGPTIDVLVRSASAPQVSFEALPTAIQDQATITWQASDADGDPLLSSLYYSNDGGLHWQILGLDMPTNRFDLKASELPGGSAIFKVSVSDGFISAESVSTPVSMPDQAPIITLIDAWGAAFDTTETVSIEAVAYDLEDGLMPSNAIQWVNAQGDILGTGTLLQTTALGAGSHLISAQVQDSTGKKAEARLEITITSAPEKPSTPLSLPSTNLLYVLGGCGCASLLGVSVVAGGVLLFARKRKTTRIPGNASQGEPFQDQQGFWWSQNPFTGAWNYWNGRAWQPMPGTAPRAVTPQYASALQTGRTTSCLLSLLTGGVIALLVVGGISLVAFNFFPPYRLTPGQGDTTQILTMTGGGLLAFLLGLLLVRGGFKTIITRQTVVVDERGRRREKSGCSAIWTGLGSLLIGVVVLIGGLGWLTLVFYQEILPWLL